GASTPHTRRRRHGDVASRSGMVVARTVEVKTAGPKRSETRSEELACVCGLHLSWPPPPAATLSKDERHALADGQQVSVRYHHRCGYQPQSRNGHEQDDPREDHRDRLVARCVHAQCSRKLPGAETSSWMAFT